MTLTSKLDFSQYWGKKKVKYFLCQIYVRSCAGLIALISKGNILKDIIFFIWPTFFFEILIIKRENDMHWFLLMTPRE